MSHQPDVAAYEDEKKDDLVQHAVVANPIDGLDVSEERAVQQ